MRPRVRSASSLVRTAMTGRGGSPDAVTLATIPGDVIVFDEHLTHGSDGGAVRRQWHVDFIAEPLDVPGHQVGDSRLIGGRPPRALWRRRVL